jgi:hypothetical protein
MVGQGSALWGFDIPGGVNLFPHAVMVNSYGVALACALLQTKDGDASVAAMGFNGDHVRVHVIRPTLEDNALPRMGEAKWRIGRMDYVQPMPYALDVVAFNNTDGQCAAAVKPGDLVICMVTRIDDITGPALTELVSSVDTAGAVSPTNVTQAIYVVTEPGDLSVEFSVGFRFPPSSPGVVVLRPVSLGRLG